jgi:glycosyltransferase involved in cell wall biosynthesis
LKPDIIQTFNIDELATYDAAIVSQRHGFKLFTESHLHASVFPEHSLKIRLKRFLNKYSKFLKLINDATVKCYPISTDAAEIAISYYRVPESKVKIQSLGVDTDLFKPCISESLKKERKELRTKLGFVDSDIVCIYTGRFTKDKNPHCLAQALHRLHNIDASYKGLFVGGGTSSDLNFIQSQSGCHVHPFVRVDKLPAFYRAADIGVWPAQESTSQLDAMACGLPIILSNKIKVFERVQGNGLLYEENNYVDLANKITELRDNHIRETMLQYGVDKIIKNYSWIVIAQERLKDYYQSMRYGGNI